MSGLSNDNDKTLSLPEVNVKELNGPSRTSFIRVRYGQDDSATITNLDHSASDNRGLFLSNSSDDFYSDANTIQIYPMDDLEAGQEKKREHCHSYRQDTADNKARRKLIIASILCVIFMIAEGVGGIMSNSLAIATDAAHLLADFASFMISLFSIWLAKRQPTKRWSFGWYRAEVIGAMTSVLLIWVITCVLVYLAVIDIVYKRYDVDSTVMLIMASIGLGINIIMGCTLHQHGHTHGGGGDHGHSHGSGHSHAEADGNSTDVAAVHTTQNINVQAAFIHVVGDFIQSLGVLVAALIIYFKPEYGIADPICTFLFSILILMTTFAILRDTLTVLMEGIPKGMNFNDVLTSFNEIEGIVKVHNLRIWALSMDKTALSAHLAIKTGFNTQKILTEATKNIRSKYNIFEMALQIEDFEDEMEDCTECQGPKK